VQDARLEQPADPDLAGALDDSAAIWVGQLELADALRADAVIEPDRASAHYARVLVRLHHESLGFVRIASQAGEVDMDLLRRTVWCSFETEIRKHLSADGLPAPKDIPLEGLGGWEACVSGVLSPETSELPVSVVVCTKDRPDSLRRVLRTLQQLEYGAFEVLVVDNAPTSSATRECVEEFAATDPRFRYLVESRAGLSRARNAGLAEALHDWVAFTDDDVLVDPWWLRAVERGIRRDDEVGCVTGLVPPASLIEPAQRYFDERFLWTRSLVARVYDLDEHKGDDALYPYMAGTFGTGANFAVDRHLVERIGGFDTALGAGSPTNGGEDLDMFVRVLLARRAIAYEPSSVIWHIHRADSEALGRQVYAYGLGLTAYLAKHILDPSTRWEVLRGIPRGVWRLIQLMSRARGAREGVSRSRTRANASYRRAELRGMFAGPLVYWRARRSDRASSASTS
jgi:glycosyltransferase involved in cell wall biosynthesis